MAMQLFVVVSLTIYMLGIVERIPSSGLQISLWQWVLLPLLLPLMVFVTDLACCAVIWVFSGKSSKRRR